MSLLLSSPVRGVIRLGRTGTVPADSCAWSVFSDENLLEVSLRNACEGFGPRTNAGKEIRHVLCLREAAAVEIIAPAQ